MQAILGWGADVDAGAARAAAARPMTLPMPHHRIGDPRDQFDAWREQVRDRLEVTIGTSCVPDPLRDAIRYGSTAPKASRWRALLVLQVAHALGRDADAALDAATAVESLHCATLSIDDLPSMDDAAERRGLPALHRRFNEAMAIQASLWLLGSSRTLMACAIASAGAHADVVSGLAALQQRTEDELQLGQFMDMMGTLGKAEVDVERLARLKCGRLFALAAQVAAWLPPVSGPGESDRTVTATALDAFGEEVGLAYQILDDLEDVGEDGSSANWSAGGQTGRPTVVAKFGVAAAKSMVDDCIARAGGALAPLASVGIDTAPLLHIARSMLGRA